MSKVAVAGNNSGTGVFTIAAPNSNTDQTFNLPDQTGQLLTDVSNIEPQVKTATNASGDAPIYACRAWVNFDGTNTTIRDSGNVSSITDIGVGRYDINFITALPDSNYSLSALSSDDDIGGATGVVNGPFSDHIANSFVRVFYIGLGGTTPIDRTMHTAQVFR